MHPEQGTIFTIGHSVHSIETFVQMLQSFDIRLLADIRSFPGSKRHPQFNNIALERSLSLSGIMYLHFPGLGGKRDPTTQVADMSARGGLTGYAAYMQTVEFKKAIEELTLQAHGQPTVYMCAEADWRQCHRAHVSAYLASAGWKVAHITGVAKMQPHPDVSTKAVQGTLF